MGLDRLGALSASRQQFTTWVYQQFLPVLWDRWTVTDCDEGDWAVGECQPFLTAGPLLSIHLSSPGVQWIDFDGLLPRQAPCHELANNHLVLQCTFNGLPEQGYGEAVKTLLDPISEECRYDPAAGHSWRYGKCTLGVPAAQILSGVDAPWFFSHHVCTFKTDFGIGYPKDGSQCQGAQPAALKTGSARLVSTQAGVARVTFQQPMDGPIDLRGAKVRLHRMLHEGGGKLELLNHHKGEDAFPRKHSVTDSATKRHAIFRTSAGAAFKLRGELTTEGGLLSMDIRIRGGSIDLPESCAEGAESTHINSHVVVMDRDGRKHQILITAPWQCVTERPHGGRVIALAYPGDYPPPRRVPRQ